jgi:hypothetical protein
VIQKTVQVGLYREALPLRDSRQTLQGDVVKIVFNKLIVLIIGFSLQKEIIILRYRYDFIGISEA